MQITSKTESGYIKVYIDNHLHLAIQKDQIQGLWSYKDDDTHHFIEITFSSLAKVTAEYDTEEKWKAVLVELDRQITGNERIESDEDIVYMLDNNGDELSEITTDFVFGILSKDKILEISSENHWFAPTNYDIKCILRDIHHIVSKSEGAVLITRELIESHIKSCLPF